MRVSTADLALVLGITDRRIQQLAVAGVLCRAEHGEWDLALSVQGYIRHRLIARRPAAARGNAEEKLKAAKAAREELRLARERGELIAADEALAIIDEALGVLRADLAGVPARLSRDPELRRRVETEIDAALGRCADKFGERADALAAARDAVAAAAEDDTGPMGSAEP